MVSGVPQETLIETAGAPVDAAGLANALGDGWRGGYVARSSFDKLMGLGRPWLADLREPGRKMGHMVVVDGRTTSGRLIVRDPSNGGSTYEMVERTFKRYWTGYVVFK
jgi:hypothetical protein